MLKVTLEEEDLEDIKNNLKVGQCKEINVAYMQKIRACRLTETRIEAKILRTTTNGEEHIVDTIYYEDGVGIVEVE